MSIFKAYPELHVEPGQVDGLYRICAKGRVVIAGHFERQEDAQRLADCWNALRKVAFPIAHVEATDEYIIRLETLRKQAVAALEAREAAQ